MPPAIKHYSIVREIGSGPTAAVYEAVDTRSRRTVALKVLHPHLRGEKTASDGFIREARSASRLDHQGIVRILDFGAEAGAHFIAMEYVHGTTMERVIKVRGAVRPTVAAEIMVAVAEALGQAHKLGLFHGNLKPANILLRKPGKVMLSDFGLFFHPPDPRMAMDAAALSRISFIAPEQIAGATVSAASDIYAWGVCLYVFMTGKLPYTAQKLPELFEEIRRKGADPDPLLMASLPAEFGGILSRCLAADPTRRFGTAAELLRECEPFRKGSAPSADLRALCGDIPEEYDQPKPAAKKKSRAAAAPVIIGSAALLGFAAFFGGRFLHGSGGSEPIAVGGAPATRVAAQPRAGLPAQTPSPPTMAAERPEVAPMQTPAPAAKAPEPPASAARRPAVKAQPAAAAALPSDSAVPGRALLKPADDSSQALLDSFSVLSPELSGEGGIKAPPAARAADSGGLFVYSDPWAAVSVDGREIGMTPLQDPVRLISGAHIVSLVSKGFATLVDTVIVTADSVIRKRYRLETNR